MRSLFTMYEKPFRSEVKNGPGARSNRARQNLGERLGHLLHPLLIQTGQRRDAGLTLYSHTP